MSSTPPAENCSRSADFDPELETYSYDLPAELIAQEPLKTRESSRLQSLNRDTGRISDHHFSDLPGLLRAGDLLVVNDTRVIPARLLARRATGGLIQILLLRPESQTPNLWRALAQPMRKLKVKESLQLLSAESNAPIIAIHDIVMAEDGSKQLIVDLGARELVHQLLSKYGYAPLPPYIARDRESQKRQDDLSCYQTVFANAPGAVAAPTAGLHFSTALVDQLAKMEVELATITLHVGPGTFKPITNSVAEHTVEPESFSVSAQTADLVNQALQQGRRVIAVGTTSCRALETAGRDGAIRPVDNERTSLYIKPGFQFRIISGLVTNFHLSRSSLLVLVSTFAGHSLIKAAYREAIEKRYRFYSYGDAMLIL